LLCPQLRCLDDLEQRHLAGAPVDREERLLPQMVDRIIAPFAGGHHAAVQAQDRVELAPVERDWNIHALAAHLAQRDEYCRLVPILPSGAAIHPISLCQWPNDGSMTACQRRRELQPAKTAAAN